MPDRKRLVRSRPVLHVIFLLAQGAWLAACAPALPLTRQECSAATLLREASRLSSLPPDRLDDELTRAKATFERTGGECDRFQVALAAFGSASRKNDAYAVTLMEDALASGAPRDDLRGMAAVLLRAFEERIYQDARGQSASRELTDWKAQADTLRRQLGEEKLRADALRVELTEERVRAEAKRRQLAEEQAGSEALRRQIDELRNIEKIINEREKR